MADKKRVGILRGGDENHYQKSLKDGGDIFLCIHEKLGENWKPVDILIDRNGIWHADGVPLSEKTDLVHKVDVVWNVAHPSFSQFFDNLKIPCFGIDSFPYALLENRSKLKEHLKMINVEMPRHMIIPIYQPDFDGPKDKYSIKKAREIFEKFGAPWVIKSASGNKNMAVHIARTFPELVEAIEDGASHKESILVEEFIVGKEAEVHMLSGFRGEDVYMFPFGNFQKHEKEKISSIAREAFRHLGISHYMKSYFKIHPKGKIYFSGMELLPAIDKSSDFAFVGQSVGASLHHVVEHILNKISLRY